MKASDFSITVDFSDGTKVSLGGDDTLFISKENDDSYLMLNDERLSLIKSLQLCEKEAIGE